MPCFFDTPPYCTHCSGHEHLCADRANVLVTRDQPLPAFGAEDVKRLWQDALREFKLPDALVREPSFGHSFDPFTRQYMMRPCDEKTAADRARDDAVREFRLRETLAERPALPLARPAVFAREHHA